MATKSYQLIEDREMPFPQKKYATVDVEMT